LLQSRKPRIDQQALLCSVGLHLLDYKQSVAAAAAAASAAISLLLQVAAFALTPTLQQYSDKHYMPPDLLRPSVQLHQLQAAGSEGAAAPSEEQHLQQGTDTTAAAASWKCML
jgi:hypothetical protein